MDLNAVKVFINVVQAGSLSKACEKLAMPIATVSRYISGLEKDLNVQLFDRFKTGVKPTALGLQFYEQVHLSMDNLLNAPQVLHENQRHLKGILRISTPEMFTPIWQKIADFKRQFPHIQLFCDVSRQPLDLVENEIDVAIRLQVSTHLPDNVIAKPIGRIRTKLIASADFVQQYGLPKTPKELDNFPCAGWALKGKLAWTLGGESVQLNGILATNDVPMLHHFAQQGLAICLLPDYLAEPLIQEKGFVEVLPDYPSPSYPINVIYASHRYPSAVVRAFLDFVRAG